MFISRQTISPVGFGNKQPEAIMWGGLWCCQIDWEVMATNYQRQTKYHSVAGYT